MNHRKWSPAKSLSASQRSTVEHVKLFLLISPPLFCAGIATITVTVVVVFVVVVTLVQC